MGGRGRGRGRAPPTGGRLMLQRSAQEAGLDANNLRSLQEITKPRLFPDYEWHTNGTTGHEEDQLPSAAPEAAPSATSAPSAAKRSPSTVYLINKSREFHHRFQNSPYYVRPTQEIDVVRFGKRPCPVAPDINVLEHIGKAADSRYVPEELLETKRRAQQLSMKELMSEDGPKKAKTLEELAENELKERRLTAALAEEGEDGDISDTVEQEEEEDEGDGDYAIEHYDSDDESDGGGGGGGDEATF
jgi:hypothetical protein